MPSIDSNSNSSVDDKDSTLTSSEKIVKFFNDDAYDRYIQDVASYNQKLKDERVMRVPFFDIHTGLAQSNSNLWRHRRERLPGITPGQMYLYPHKRWIKRRRQYLSNYNYRPPVESSESVEGAPVDSGSMLGVGGEESRDSFSAVVAQESRDSWYYDDYGLEDEDDFNDPGEDDDYDYEDSYSKKKKKKSSTAGGGGGSKKESSKKSSTGTTGTGSEKPSKKSAVAAALSKRPSPASTPTFVDFAGDDKPFVCDLCGARYKTRPGLSYHYSHTHKDVGPPGVRSAVLPQQMSGGSYTQNPAWGDPAVMAQNPAMVPPPPNPATTIGKSPDALAGLERFQDNFLTFLKTTDPVVPTAQNQPGTEQKEPVGPENAGGEMTAEPETAHEQHPRPSGVSPSTYCDFCLGDATQNKKTNEPEELVSCSDCGRSGHPSCLQFSPNMKISVKKYRWQCIECKCCTLCGNSDNDEQLLFCDDCDRGYHMYCLNPPLSAPPEGSWSCELCIDEFHPELKGGNGIVPPPPVAGSEDNSNNSMDVNSEESDPPPPQLTAEDSEASG
ncbi:unnamed protein product [Cyprideis torosa]|uniref:Uncharacterized protein n=1 Tax=Cyprideis torosa TaxID=163714 RepID=A0A7R8ZN51_9CRUS|nr:unnamed protein product [Cyprideis torosa]CAG0890658.1 unnamed protein product [Cyprideis torosa]